MKQQDVYSNEMVTDFLQSHRSLKDLPLKTEADKAIKQARREYCRQLAEEIKTTNWLFYNADIRKALELAHTFYK